MLWQLSHRRDPFAADIADRHYNRRKIGSPQFVPPGRCLVLKANTETGRAFWITSWPFAQYVKHQWAGAWVCTAFRNEGAALSSDLVRQALACSLAFFGNPPTLGMITFVDPKKVRHKRDFGRCYRKIGFKEVGKTKGGLVALQLLPRDMPLPQEPIGFIKRHKDFTPVLDLNHHSGLAIKPPDFADHVNQAIDNGILARRAKEKPRNYLGASLLGDPCARRLVYIATQTTPDADFTPKTLRTFDIGHSMEDFLGGSESDSAFSGAATRWFHDAGFDLKTRDSTGHQFGWQTINGKIQGHIDGVLLAGPPIDGMHYPALWECKSANKKNWSKFKKSGVRVGSVTYFGQMQLNMAYLDVPWCVFTAINKDTSELTHEMVAFDPAVAQRLSDRALEVVTMASKGELPERVASHADYYLCKMCGFYKRCWQL